MRMVQDRIQSMRDLLGDAQATVRLQDGDLSLPCGALLDALERCLQDCTGDLDDFNADEAEMETLPPPPETVYVSTRNTDPDYRAAREEFNQMRVAELRDNMQKPDGPIVSLLGAHRDTLDESDRALQAWAGECNEQYLGKSAGVYAVHLPGNDIEPLDPVLQLHWTLLRFCHGVKAASAVWDAVIEREAMLQATLDRFPAGLRDLVLSGAFLSESGMIPDPMVLGQVGEDAGDGPTLVVYALANHFVMILLQSD